VDKLSEEKLSHSRDYVEVVLQRTGTSRLGTPNLANHDEIIDSMLDSTSSNLSAGTQAPATGIYVVSHLHPAPAPPHEVLISARMILPGCSACEVFVQLAQSRDSADWRK
jgi:hypothetical protein